MSIEDKKRVVASALHRLDRMRRQEAFDPAQPDSRPTLAQQEVIDDFGKIRHQYIRAGSQGGKTSCCARLLTWFLTDTNPKWKRPASWGDEKILCVVAGRTGKQIEESLLPRIKGYLEPGTYKEVRLGNIIQRLEITSGTGEGNRVVFQSLENPTTARERLQSYTAHLAWVDELPPTIEIVMELLRSIQARDGHFLASFTPLVRSLEVQQFVDQVQLPKGKVYRFNMLDNPVYADPKRKEEILQTLATLPDAQRKARLFGDWMTGDDAVYHFDYNSMVELPIGYSPLWRHVESVDPALKSALGLTMWAENPVTGIWYLVKSEEVKGILVPTELVKAVRDRTSHMNIVRRISDPHEVWYIQTAAAMGIHYIGVHKKNERKSELIKQFQECLGPRIRISPTETDFIAEIQDCRWSDKTDGKIVNASSYHMLDAAQYFCDNIPRPEKTIISGSWQEWLYKANEKRKLDEEKVHNKQQRRLQVRRRNRQWA